MAPPFQDYRLGDTLSLAVDGIDPSPNTIRVRIQELKTQTLSCTMVVEVDSKLGLVKQPVKTAFLKLYDRRFSDKLRWCNGIAPWEPAMENAYVNAIQAGTVYHFLEDLYRIENFKQDTEEGWDAAQKEGFLADTLLQYYANEVAVYQALRKFQGQAIPRLIAAVDLNLTPPNAQDHHELLHVKGILLEYVDGFCLAQLADYAPRSAWQDIVNQALEATHILGDYNILDYDRRPGNFLVSPREGGSFQVFMIDFGYCRLKREDELDRDFGKAKRLEDEEGGIGMVIQKILKNRHNFELRYTRSGRYNKWEDAKGGELWDKYGKITVR